MKNKLVITAGAVVLSAGLFAGGMATHKAVTPVVPTVCLTALEDADMTIAYSAEYVDYSQDLIGGSYFDLLNFNRNIDQLIPKHTEKVKSYYANADACTELGQ